MQSPSTWLRTPHLATSARRTALAVWQRSLILPGLQPCLPPATSSAAAITARAALRGGWGPSAAGGRQRAMSGDVPFVDTAKLVVKYARSSGPGGQHVNKTESKVDMRINLQHIQLPPEAIERLRQVHGGKINKLSELVITCDENRERQRNYETCLLKLSDMLTAASIPPKARNMKSKTAGKFHARRLVEKREASAKKESRRRPLE